MHRRSEFGTHIDNAARERGSKYQTFLVVNFEQDLFIVTHILPKIKK
jgi:hypothetical protein